MDDLVHWYVSYFAKEVEYGHLNKFTGNMSFQVNFREGVIGNMNIGVNQSVKREISHEQVFKANQKA